MQNSFSYNYSEVEINEYYEDELQFVSLIENTHNSRWLTPEQAKHLWLNHLVASGISPDDIPDIFWLQIRRTIFPKNNLNGSDKDDLENLAKELLVLAGASTSLLAIVVVLLFIEKSKKNQKSNITIIDSKDISIDGSTIDKSKKENINLTEQTENIINIANPFQKEGLSKPVLIAIHPPSQRVFFSPKVFDYLDETKLNVLLGATTNKDPNERSMAINYLAHFPQNDDITRAILQALNDISPLVRATAADVAGEIKITNADKKLIEIIENPNETPTVKNNAAIALAEIGTPDSIKFLVNAVNMEWEDFTLKQIIKANPNRILKPIIKEFTNHARAKELAYSKILLTYPLLTVDVCIDLLRSDNREYLITTSTVLEMVLESEGDKLKLNDIKKIIRLCERMLNDEDFKTRYHAIRILGNLRNQNCIPYLVQSLSHSDVNTRAFAAYYLEQFRNDENALASLIHAYTTEKDKVLKSKIEDLLGKDRPKSRYEKWLNHILVSFLVMSVILFLIGTVLDASYCDCGFSRTPYPYNYILFAYYVLMTMWMLFTAFGAIFGAIRDNLHNDKDDDLFWKKK